MGGRASVAWGALGLLLLLTPRAMAQSRANGSDGGTANGAGGAPSPGMTVSVSSAVQLQTALSPQGPGGLDAVDVTGDIFLDPLSFLPTLPVERPLRLCGANRGVTLSAVEAFPVVLVNASVTLCDLTLDLTFRGVGNASRAERMMFELGARGRLAYERVDLYVGQELFSRLLADLEVARGAGNGSNGVRAVSGPARVAIESVVLEGVELRDVVVRLEESPYEDPTDRTEANSTKGVSRLTGARQINPAPLDVRLVHNFTVTNCLLEAIAKGVPIAVRRPLTLTPRSGEQSSWMVFTDDLQEGFLDVKSQVRFDGVSVENRALSLELFDDGVAGGSRCSPSSCLNDTANATSAIADVDRSMLIYDRNMPGCRFVMRNAMMVHSCEFVRDFGTLLLYHRNTIQNQTKVTRSLGDFVGLSDIESADEKTIRFRRFMGWGMCMENTVMTCDEVEVLHKAVPRCLMFEGTLMTDPEGTTEPGGYYYEGTSSIDDETNTSDYYPTSSDYEDEEQAPRSKKITRQVTSTVGIVLVALGGLVVVAMAAVYVFWSRMPKLPWGKDYRDVGAGSMRASDEGTPGSGSRKARNGEVHDFIGKVEGKAAEARPELTKESLIVAISEQSAGIEDSCAKIENQIAAGGNGVVYKGVWKGIPVAIKTVVFQDVMDSSSRQRQRAVFEAAISSSVAHRNIVQTYAYSFKRLESSALTTDFVTTKRPPQAFPDVSNVTQVMVDWKLFIVLEFCNGGSLRDCLDEKRLLGRDNMPNLPALIEIGQGVASGLNHLHTQHNIVHGDLSSKNILLKKDPGDGPDVLGVAKIADFGLSIKMGMLQSHISNQRAGTPFYMAPEVCQNGIMSKKADVFSFGVFMWELYHSKKCYHAGGGNSGLRYHPLFPKFPITCPIPYAMLCVVCISPDPRNRPDFNFVSRVLAALKKQADGDEFSDAHDLRVRNMQLATGLGKLTPEDILSVIAEQVGIPVVDPLTAGGSDDGTLPGGLSPAGGPAAVAHPDNMFLNPSYDSQKDVHPEIGAVGSPNCPVHLNQAFVAPFHCAVSVSVSMADEHNPVAPVGFDEEFAISWQCESGAEPAWQRNRPEERHPGGKAGVLVSDLSSQCWPCPISVTGGESSSRDLVVDLGGGSGGGNGGSMKGSLKRERSAKMRGGEAKGNRFSNAGTDSAPLEVPVSVDVQSAFLMQHPMEDVPEECEDQHSGLLEGQEKSDSLPTDGVHYQFPNII